MHGVAECFDTILTRPDWMLAAFEPGGRELHFVQTTKAVLLEAAFIDGRTRLSPTGRRAVIPLEDVVAWMADQRPPHVPDRFIAHVGFCCSTLLTRALDATGACLAYREPQVFTDMCMLKTTGHGVYADAAVWNDLLLVVKNQFRKRFGETPSLVKLSNWPVNILPDLLAGAVGARAVFITCERRDYLVAILRGGAERAGFMLKFTQKLRRDFAAVDAAVWDVETACGLSTLQRVLRCALIALHAQEQMFDRLIKTSPAGHGYRFAGAGLLDDPGAVLSRIGAALALDIGGDQQSAAVRDALTLSAKQPGMKFDRPSQDAENARVRNVFGDEIEQALCWADGRELCA